MIAFGMSDAKRTSAERPGGFGKRGSCGQRRAWDLKQDLRRGRQGASNSDQGPTRTHVECSGKFKELFAFLVAAADKNGDCQGQPRPLPTFLLGSAPNHELP
jgi:hypothetical protein